MIGGYRSELGPGSSSQAMISANTAYDPVDTVFWRAHGVVPNCTMIELALPPQDRRRVLEPTKQKEASSLDWNAVLGRDQSARTSAGDVGTDPRDTPADAGLADAGTRALAADDRIGHLNQAGALPSREVSRRTPIPLLSVSQTTERKRLSPDQATRCVSNFAQTFRRRAATLSGTPTCRFLDSSPGATRVRRIRYARGFRSQP